MRERLSQLAGRPWARSVVVGGSVYLFEIAVIVAAQQAGASAVWAVTISYVLGTLLAFGLQKFVTFGDMRRQRRIVAGQLLATGALVAWNLGFTVLLTRLLQDSLPAVIIRTLAILITTSWNFYLYRTSIFKTSDKLVY